MDKVLDDKNGTRTHEPSLRELTAELDGLRELLLSKIEANKEILDERDKLYTERDNSRRAAVEAALTAVKEQTRASFDASEKAIVKAEESQKSYNASHNDLIRKMEEQNRGTIPRPEIEARLGGLEEKISSLRDSKSNLDGRLIILGVIGAAVLATLGSWIVSSPRGPLGSTPPAQILYVPARTTP